MTYFIESPHTKDECVAALDDMASKHPEFLDKCWMGCMAGTHTSWATVEANSASEAREMLPSFLRDKAHVVEVQRYTPEDIRSLHA